MTPDWENQANCRYMDSDVFYPRHNDLASINYAKNVCGGCPVIVDCLELAFRTDDAHAVMGGLSAVERGRLLAAASFDKKQAVNYVKEQVNSYATT